MCAEFTTVLSASSNAERDPVSVFGRHLNLSSTPTLFLPLPPQLLSSFPLESRGHGRRKRTSESPIAEKEEGGGGARVGWIRDGLVTAPLSFSLPRSEMCWERSAVFLK